MTLASGKDPSSFSRSDFLFIAVWWGLLTGLAEAYWAPAYVWIWRDLMRAGVEVEPWLFLALGVVLLALKRRRALGGDDVMQATFLFGGLTLFACLSRSLVASPSMVIQLLIATAGASLLGFLWLLHGSTLVRWQKRTLPVLAFLALWCLVGFPIKQRIHERRETAKLAAAAQGAPNVLLIVVDTLRADHLSTYGYARPTSPHLTQLAAQGTLFENAIAPSSWTLPSHASLLTGLYPQEHHVESGGALLGWDYPVLGNEFRTRGYRTAAFSANTPFFSRRRGFGRGFIHFEDDFQSLGSSFAQTFYGDLIKHLLFRLQWKRDLFGRRSAEQINQHALRWIDNGHQPFFVFLNYMDVHDPYRPPEPYLHRYTKMRDPGSRASEHWEWLEHLMPEQRQGAMDAYDGAINYVDDHIQELLQNLRQRGLDRNTLVVITSDHGEGFGEHGLMAHGNSLYRELIHVPLILLEPGKIPAGRRINAPVSLTSLPATLLEEAGEVQHPHFPQPSLAGWLSGEASPVALPDPISQLAQLPWSPNYPNYYGPMESISTRHWHYIRGGKAGEELFACCGEEPEQLNLAGTVVGRELAMRFAGELAPAAADELTATRSKQPALGTTYQLDFEPTSLALNDFNGNGDMDILVRGRNHRDVALLLGDGKGAFQRTSDAARILKAFAARKMGVHLSLASNAMTSDRQGCGPAPAGQPGGARCSVLRGELGDLNGDGLQDLLFDPGQAQHSTWLRATAGGKFYLMKVAIQTVDPGKKQPITLTRGDVDGNGLEDLAFADEAHNDVVFLLATQPGVFIKTTVPVAGSPRAIGLADLNHNGRADLVVTSRARKSITVLLSCDSRASGDFHHSCYGPNPNLETALNKAVTPPFPEWLAGSGSRRPAI
jgi:arylsulfatase A-like enzyme